MGRFSVFDTYYKNYHEKNDKKYKKIILICKKIKAKPYIDCVKCRYIMGEGVFELVYIIGQILGIIAVVLGFISFQQKTQLRIIIFECVTALVFSAHYLLISAPTAVALNLLSVFICIFLAVRNKRQGENKIGVAVCSFLIAISGILTWENIYSVFLITGLVLHIISLSFSNPQNTRRAMLIKAPLCIVYNLAVASMGGIVFECAVLVSAVVGLIKYKKEYN